MVALATCHSLSLLLGAHCVWVPSKRSGMCEGAREGSSLTFFFDSSTCVARQIKEFAQWDEVGFVEVRSVEWNLPTCRNTLSCSARAQVHIAVGFQARV